MDIDVRTQQGVVRGRMDEGVATFKGIPYAAPPFGANRFRPPQPAERWDGVREAFNYGPTVPKPPYFPPFDVLLPEPAIPGEDCLNLNIWSPDVGRTGLPVMVWIHGGAFANGSNAIPQYEGSRFARDGVVCVTINYRLGADGFLFMGDGISNLGLLDQIAALVWVQENIVAFGGDPNYVTIFGESAGAINYINDDILAGAVAAYGLPVAETIATYRSIRPDASAGDLLASIVTDWFFRVPAIRLAEAQIKGNNATYMYEFAWRSPGLDGQLGSCHALEVPFVFDTLDTDGFEILQGTEPPQRLADAMHAAWVAFATSGNPGWPQFDLNRRATMRFGTKQELVEDPRSAERQLWEGLR